MNQATVRIREDWTDRPQVLIMEDESSVGEALQMILADEGYGVDWATTGRGALDSLDRREFDLLVADLRLPDMNGMDVVKEVKRSRPQTEVIIITGYGNVPTAVEAMKTGAVEYLAKPFTDDQFKSAVEAAVRDKEEGTATERATLPREVPLRVIRKRDVLKALSPALPAGRPPLRDTQGGDAKVVGTAASVRDLRGPKAPDQAQPDQSTLLHQQKMIALGRLAASAIHEINNPLAGVLNYLRLMQKVLGRDASPTPESLEKFRKYLGLVESETDRCSRIISNLLAFSRKPQMEFTDVDLRDLFERSIMLSRHKLELQNIRLVKEMGEKIPAVRGNFNQIQQCLINLIFNAMDAMPVGGTLTLGCRLDRDREAVEIWIRDTGCGIPEGDLPHIFEPFFTTKSEGKGLGLGLSTVRDIVDRHKGTIHVESEVGKGTVFTIRIPLI